MKRYMVWCVCLLAWMISCSGMALAENEFERFCAQNNIDHADVIAWIEIPEAEFCQPVMCSESDDSFYASHDAQGADFEYGALFVQSAYNAADFSDPVTVIYGSSKARGAPFRDLQELYSGSFDQCRKMLIHLPEETLEYSVFAAVPYSSLHILHYYDFNVKRRYEGFFDDVYSTRLLGMHLDEDSRPEFGDNVLILSTGLRGDGMQRYLVMAKIAANS